MTTDTVPAAASWPKQSWFVRDPLVSTVIMVAAVAALATEFAVMLIAGEQPTGYLGLCLSSFGVLFIIRARWVGLVLTTLGAIASTLFATEYVGVWTVTVFAMFLFAKQGRHVIPALAVTASSLYLVLAAREVWQFDAPIPLVAATFCVAAAAAGSVLRLQKESWDAALQRAVDLAATQALELRQAVKDERLRIARDLHDVVGHELAVVNINVGVAEISLPSEADQARQALRFARDGLQRTLHETQQILDLLRDGGQDLDERSELALVDHIPSLVARFAAAGADVEAHIAAELPPLETDVSAAAYRIVQEALTNAGKYGSGPALLSVLAVDTRLIIEIENPAVSSDVSQRDRRVGYGLVGMRERTAAAGGTLDISQPGDTFRVRVELPTKDTAT